MIQPSDQQMEAVAQGCLSVSEACRVIGVKRDFVLGLMDDGELDYVDLTRPGAPRRNRRPTRKSVMEYAARHVVLRSR